MHTSTNTYITKFSSGLIIALLAFSGLLVLVPIVTNVNATGTNKSPTFTLAPNVITGCTSGTCPPTAVDITVANPSTNPYAITAFTVTAPSGWSFSGSGTFYTANQAFYCTLSSTSVACAWYNAELAPGSSLIIYGGHLLSAYSVELTPAASTSFPLQGTFTTSIQDASSAAYYPGSSFPVWSIDPTTTVTVALSPTTTTFVAGGSPYAVTATVGGTTSVAEGSIPVTWTIEDTGAGTVSPASSTTSASGTASATFIPSNKAGAANYILATLGNVPTEDIAVYYGFSSTVTTVAGPPSTVLLTYLSTGGATASSPAFPTTHYETTNNATASALGMAEIYGTDLFYSVADAYGNPVCYPTCGAGITLTITSGTITAAGGSFCEAGELYPCAVQLSTTLSSGNLGSSDWTIGTTPDLAVTYWQSGEYGWAGEITISLTGTYNPGTGAVSFGTIRTATNKIVTSTFAGVATDVTFNDATDKLAAPTIAAGSTYSPSIIINPLQEGVPITMQVCTSCAGTTTPVTTAKYNGTFTATKAAEFSGLTNSSGELQSPFAVDHVAGTTVALNATWTQQTDSGITTLTTTASTTVKTVPGSPAKFVVVTGFGAAITPGSKYAVEGSTIGVDISLADAYGNPAVAPPSSPEIQITLSPSSGLLSATFVYIPASDSATNSTAPASSFGAIYWSMPSSLGTYTLTATGVVNGVSVKGTGSVTTVTSTPTFSITSPSIPTAGVIYSSSPTVVFSGEANISLGYPPTNYPLTCTTSCPTMKVTIARVGYKIGTSSWSSATLLTGSTSGSYGWDAVAFLTAGLNTVQFNATDSNGNVYLSPSYKILVDPSAPTVTFTTLNNAVLSNGAPAIATIVVGEGDLNATSVTASVNGTALPSGDISISGTNNIGSSVTYTVSITLPSGSDYIGLTAASLAGLKGTAAAITVTVSVPIDATFVSSGTGLPTSTTVNSFPGISTTFTNKGATPITAQFWIQFTGPTTSAEFQGSTLAPGGTTTVFFGTAGLAPGSYSATVYVSVGLTPYSAIYSVTFTVP